MGLCQGWVDNAHSTEWMHCVCNHVTAVVTLQAFNCSFALLFKLHYHFTDNEV